MCGHKQIGIWEISKITVVDSNDKNRGNVDCTCHLFCANIRALVSASITCCVLVLILTLVLVALLIAPVINQ